uniref:FHA domain-containing protein n=1 Tax=Leersia perrieri TaxID=77586 RepID=A0A0D9X6P2_9ORYZ
MGERQNARRESLRSLPPEKIRSAARCPYPSRSPSPRLLPHSLPSVLSSPQLCSVRRKRAAAASRGWVRKSGVRGGDPAPLPPLLPTSFRASERSSRRGQANPNSPSAILSPPQPSPQQPKRPGGLKSPRNLLIEWRTHQLLDLLWKGAQLLVRAVRPGDMYRGGLDRFKKAQALEPFSVQSGSSAKNAPVAARTAKGPPAPLTLPQNSYARTSQSHPSPQGTSSRVAGQETGVPGHAVGTQVGGGQSVWQPPDWAIEPRPGVYYLEVLKDREVIDRINLEKKRHIFGRQVPACDFVLDHQSVSRQHAAVVPHRNGSIYVIDLGSVHGTFVANERLTKDNPVELEVGQSLRFAASTRTYILRKNAAAFFPTHSLPSDVSLPSPPDPNDEDAVVAYNTILNRYGISKSNLSSRSKDSSGDACGDDKQPAGRPLKRSKKQRVSFRDQIGGELIQVVGISDGADVETEPGPVGVKEGNLVGKYESLVTVVPKGKEQPSPKESASPSGVTDKLKQAENVKAADEKRSSGRMDTNSADDNDDLFGIKHQMVLFIRRTAALFGNN